MRDKSPLEIFVYEISKHLGIFLTDGLIVKYGWNLLLADLFPSLHHISYGNALVIIILAGILFKQKIVQTLEYKIGG